MIARHAPMPYWNSYEGDIVLCPDMNELTIKLPPLPKGKWQVRLGYSSSNERPVINTYIDGVLQFSNIDLRESKTAADVAADNNIFQGPDDYYLGDDVTMADRTWLLRRVIGTFTSDGNNNHYLRFENQLNGTETSFQLDYLEFVPVN